jgi:SAM-dependent methyltransferase
MRPNVVQLRQFYASRLGRKVKQRLRQLVLQYWPDTAQQVVVGLGYAIPVLRVLERGKPSALLALMPVNQGAIYWPVHSENHGVLGDEVMPPFAPGSLHRVVMLHAFEHVARPQELLSVYWKMLAPGGKMLLIVPNRRGSWARFGNNPFGRGTPYSVSQLRELLEDAQFTINDITSALFGPPSRAPFWLKLWKSMEDIGSFLFPMLGGVLIIEVEKQIYAGIAERAAMPAKWATAPISHA